MKKFLKTFAIFTFCAIVQLNYAQAKAETKNIEDVKTFDFERVLEETEKYFNAAHRWTKIKCTPKSSFVCTKRQCPELKDNNSHFVIDKKKETLSICRNQNCKLFKAIISNVGVFNTIKIKGSDGMLLRVLGDNRYKEITMIGLDAYISNGECVDFDEKEKKIVEEKEEQIKESKQDPKRRYRLKKGQ